MTSHAVASRELRESRTDHAETQRCRHMRASPVRGAVSVRVLAAIGCGVLGVFMLLAVVLQSRSVSLMAPERVLAAETTYAEGLALRTTSPDAARVKFVESAALFGSLFSESGAPGLAFNQGNALLQAGQVGPAIAAYRAAERLDPDNRTIAANLAEARAKVARVTELHTPTWIERASFASSVLNMATRAFLAALLLWSAVLAVILQKRGIAIFATSMGVAFAATVALDFVRRGDDTAAVLERPTALRKGNGDGFELVISEPLPAGTECRVREVRPGWVEVDCSPNVSGWVRETALIRVP